MKTHLLILFLSLSIHSFAQQEGLPVIPGEKKRERPKIGLVFGKVLDKQSGEQIEYATVALISSKNEELIAGNVTSAKGTFIISEIPVGKYSVKVSYIGYETLEIADVFITKDQPSIDLSKLFLDPAAQSLEEIAIIEDRAFIQNKIDKKVINVESMAASETATATEILQYAPSIEVSMEGNISLRGSESVRILIDGKPSGLNDDQSSILDQLPANSIQSIEIITNPSAKYDPEGVGGIINVILKKNKLKGYNGNMNLGVGTLPNYNAGFNLNYKSDRFNLFGNYNFRYDDRDMEGTSFLENNRAKNRLNQFENGTRKGSSHVGKAGLDVFINDRNTIGFFSNIQFRSRERSEKNLYMTLDSLNDQRPSTRKSVDESTTVSADYNLNYRHEFLNPKHFFIADVNYSDNQRENTDDIIAEQAVDLVSPLYVTEQQVNSTEDKSDILIGQFDYTNPINARILLEAGAKVEIRLLNNMVEITDFDSLSGEYNLNDTLSNNFDYDEKIFAVYGIYRQKLGLFSFQAGLRLENTLTVSELIQTNEKFDNDYFSWFPSFFAMYEPDRTQEIQFSYSRRIKRPGIRQLNPFTTFSDAFRIRTGNPFLLPEYTNSFELGYSKFWKSVSFLQNVYYRHTDDPINRVISVDTNNVTIVTYDNIGSESTYGIELSAIASPFKWWNINTGLDMRQTAFTGANETSELSSEAFYWALRLIQTFKLPADLSIQVFTRYRGPRVRLQGEIEDMFMADISIKKLILENKGSLGLRIADVFNTREFRMHIVNPGIEQDIYRKRESRSISFSFTYKFGNLKAEKKNRNGNRQEQNNGGGELDIEF